MNEPKPPGEATKKEDPNLRIWQGKLRPWIIIVISLTGVLFFLLSAWQVNRILRSINETGQYDRGREPEVTASLDRHMLYTMTGLECYAIQRRYHQADIAMLARIWIKYLGFFTGMVLAVIGASLILGKLQESNTNLTGKLQAFEFSLISASPGLVMVLLGSMLIMTAILEHQQISVQDRPLYISVMMQKGSAGQAAVVTVPAAASADNQEISMETFQDAEPVNKAAAGDTSKKKADAREKPAVADPVGPDN